MVEASSTTSVHGCHLLDHLGNFWSYCFRSCPFSMMYRHTCQADEQNLTMASVFFGLVCASSKYLYIWILLTTRLAFGVWVLERRLHQDEPCSIDVGYSLSEWSWYIYKRDPGKLPCSLLFCKDTARRQLCSECAEVKGICSIVALNLPDHNRTSPPKMVFSAK